MTNQTKTSSAVKASRYTDAKLRELNEEVRVWTRLLKKADTWEEREIAEASLICAKLNLKNYKALKYNNLS